MFKSCTITLKLQLCWCMQHVPRILSQHQNMLVLSSNIHSFILLKQKLPFTIPELVQASPCRSSDGVLYMGNVMLCIVIKHIIL